MKMIIVMVQVMSAGVVTEVTSRAAVVKEV